MPWESFNISFADVAEGETTSWKLADYSVFFRDPRQVLHNQLANRDYAKEMDYAPKIVKDETGTRRYCDFMSGQWAWRQVVRNSMILFILDTEPFSRTKSRRILTIMDPHFVLSFWAVIKQLSLSQPVKTNTTRYTCPMAWFTTMYAEPIATPLHWWRFWLYLKVRSNLKPSTLEPNFHF